MTAKHEVLFSCNFETTACVNSIKQEKQNDDIDFKIRAGWDGEWSTGPETDHTFKNSTGNYFFIDANADGVQMGDRAVIHLLEEGQRFREGTAVLSLAFHMLDNYGPRNQMGTLNVYTDCGGVRNVTWSVDGDQGMNWHKVSIGLECAREPVQVSIEAVRNGVLSDIAIDDVQLVDIFEGDPLPPATHSTSKGPSSSGSTPPPSSGMSGSTHLTNPGMGGTSGHTLMPGGSGTITPPIGNGANDGLGLDIIVPIAAAALVALILIIILVIVLIIHRQRKSSKGGGETLEPPSQLYENNIFADASPDRKYESLQGPLSNSDRIYEELNHKKSTMEMRPKGNPATRVPHPANRMNGYLPPAMRRSMPELGDNFYDRINDRVNERPVERVVPVESATLNNNNVSRADNSHNSYIDRSQTYHPGVRGSYPEDHPYFTLMPDVVSSTAFQDDRILFSIPPPPSSTPPPLPPPPRDYDYGRPLASGMIEEEVNEYHDVLDVDKRRPLSINSDFDDDDALGRHRLAMDMVADRGFEMGSDLRLSRDTDISGRMDLDFDMDVDMRMSADGEADIHNMDTLEMPRAAGGYDRGRDRRSRDMEIERNLDQPHPHPSHHLHQRYGGSLGSIDRRRNVVADNDVEQELKEYEQHPSPYHHIEEDPQGHIRMVNLNYSPSVVHV
nr:uncharacterized protein LOC129280756 [Lytechinus pictus]